MADQRRISEVDRLTYLLVVEQRRRADLEAQLARVAQDQCAADIKARYQIGDRDTLDLGTGLIESATPLVPPLAIVSDEHTQAPK